MGAIGAGLSMALFIGLFALGGHQLDRYLDSSPWCLVAATMLGVAGSFLHLVRTLAPELLPRAMRRAGADPEEKPQQPNSGRAPDDPSRHEP